MANLSAAKIRTLKEPGKYSDGSNGLLLRIAPGGSQQWVQRITIEGKRKDLGLGAFPHVSLAQARQKAAENKSAVANGRNPLAEKHKAEVPSFREAGRAVFELNRPTWKNQNHIDNWWGSLELHALPYLGSIRVDQIQASDVLQVLTPIWTSRPETARRVRQRIRTILRWCWAHGFVHTNAAGEVLDGALPRMPKLVKGHLRAMDYREVAAALATVDASGAALATKLCLRFVVLTACRSGESREAVWSEVDLDSRVWTVPAHRMKRNREHKVPLSNEALSALAQARILRDASDLVFPSPQRQGRPMSDMAMTKLLRDCGLADRATVHGFRTSFKVWSMECTNLPWIVSESALAHALGDATVVAYARSDLLEQRRELMERWADFLYS